jgi:hypothetical protein
MPRLSTHRCHSVYVSGSRNPLEGLSGRSQGNYDEGCPAFLLSFASYVLLLKTVLHTCEVDFDNLAKEQSDRIFQVWIQNLLRNSPEKLAGKLASRHYPRTPATA